MAGSPGVYGRNYLDGRFFGPNGEETYGVFSTSRYTGAFGAKRQ